MKNRSHGFTLMELMIVLALAAAIFAIGAPSFNEFRRNNRLTGIANDFLGAIQVARGEAIKQQVPVAVCPSDNATDMDATCTTGTFRGWMTFVDKDNDCVRDADETVLRTEARVDGDAAKPLYTKSAGVCISFAATGFRQSETDTGMLAPVGTPPAIISRLTQETLKVLQRPDVKKRFFDASVEIVANSPEQFTAVMKSESARLGKVIKDAGIRAE